jgi:type I restriction enzyme S subunit
MLTHRHRTILGDIPADWDAKPLKTLITEHFAGDWGADEGEQVVAVMRSTNFTNDGQLDFSDIACRYFPKAEADQFGLLKGDLLVERSGGGPEQPVGRIGFIERDMLGSTVSNFLQVMRPDPEKVDAEYLGWALFELQRTGIVERVQQQSTQMRNLNWRDYQRLMLPWPKLDEQRRIASAIKLADDAVGYAQRKVAATRQFKLSVMSELFARGLRSGSRDLQDTKLGFVPSDWTVCELRSLWTGSANGLYVPEEHYGSGIPIVRIDAFNDGFFEAQSFKRIRVKRDDVEAFSLEPGDLLLNRVNSIPFLGKVAYVEAIQEFTVFESNMMRLRFASHELAKYLSLYLSVPATKKRIWAMGRPAVAQLSINQRDVGKFLVALPEEAERKEITDAISVTRDAERRAQLMLESAFNVKRALLQNLLTGAIRMTEGASNA